MRKGGGRRGRGRGAHLIDLSRGFEGVVEVHSARLTRRNDCVPLLFTRLEKECSGSRDRRKRSEEGRSWRILEDGGGEEGERRYDGVLKDDGGLSNLFNASEYGHGIWKGNLLMIPI